MNYLYLALFIVAIGAAVYASYSLFRRMPWATEETADRMKKVMIGTFLLLTAFSIYFAITQVF